MADEIRAQPRNSLAALLSDAINSGVGYMKSPQRTQQLQGLGRLIESTGIPYTAQSLSYDPSGRGLFTGAGGLGGTTRMRPEALEAAMTVAPMVGPAARVASRGMMAAGRAGERVAERVVPQIMGRGGLPAELLQGMSRGTVSPLDVYHGSPYRFPPTARNPLGEFDASKIGTGEGNQAYGHGIYTAEAQGVGRGYQKALSNRPDASRNLYYDGKEVGQLAKSWQEQDVNDFAIRALQDVSSGMGSDQKAMAVAQQVRKVFPDAPLAWEDQVTEAARLIDANKGQILKGNLYKADLPDEKIAKMLDWDKPLSEEQMISIYDKMQQTELASFAKPFQDNFYRRMELGQPTTDGQDLFMELSKELGGQKQVSEYLRRIDVPGIKYLDEQSRGTRYSGDSAYLHASNSFKDSGYTFDQALEGMKQAYKTANQKELKDALDAVYAPRTQNFVVFPGEEKSMRILERNGETAASPFYQDPFPDTTR